MFSIYGIKSSMNMCNEVLSYNIKLVLFLTYNADINIRIKYSMDHYDYITV